MLPDEINAEIEFPIGKREEDVSRQTSLPQDFSSLRLLLLARKDDLPKRLAQVANFMMSYPDEIALGTAASIAEKAKVQPSALVRFAQALGYQGFSEIQALFRERLRDRIPNYEDRMEALRSHPKQVSKSMALLDGFTDAAKRSVGALQKRTMAEQMDEAVRILVEAETIYLIGQRRSFPVISYMSYAFGTLGIKTVLIGTGPGTDIETLSFATPKDAAFSVSFTPYASGTVSYTKQMAALGVPQVVITDSPFSPLIPSNGIWFEVVEVDFEGFRSLSATMTLAMTLCVAVAEARR